VTHSENGIGNRSEIILRFEIGLFGYRAQPSGLHPHPKFSDFEFSHSLVNTTQWLTGSAAIRSG
jgi:hypothetical protein